ncbi:hypothetical protein CC78DRAFT_293360 [Lojkania enalia]|uniref:C2H2-type domain-containing protein n=1 Tax=Lojkania enalia TaxID=147567 RepID=A0A9P4K8F7_9PLEO|nr:hypothetical protein CC78DRAFT_293360 [Didymosphaeria enalia]
MESQDPPVSMFRDGSQSSPNLQSLSFNNPNVLPQGAEGPFPQFDSIPEDDYPGLIDGIAIGNSHSRGVQVHTKGSAPNKTLSPSWRIFEVREEDIVAHEKKNYAAVGSQRDKAKCSFQSCNYTYHSRREYHEHLKACHPDAYSCPQCGKFFPSLGDVGIHSSKTGHTSMACDYPDCSRIFSRLDTYQWHRKTHEEHSKRFPCKYWKKYRGSNGFKGKDHLTRHLRGSHHIGEEGARDPWYIIPKFCPHENSPEHRFGTFLEWYKNLPFKKPADYAKHMRTVQDPCTEPDCDRVGAKGYFRQADLRIHMKKAYDKIITF